MSAVVEINGVRFAYPDGREALRGVDLRVEEGERVALLGPNGAGKTTLALHLNGIHRPAAGQVSVGGQLVDDAHLGDVRRRVGLVFQDPDDQLFMPTVREDVGFGPANLGVSGDELEVRIQTALDTVGAADVADRAPHHLSGGEKRRVAIATVLAMQPEVLVLDEPTSNLDPRGRRRLVKLLERLPMTQIVITHDLPVAAELCERAVLMLGGRITADGPMVEILDDESLLAENGLELPFGFRPHARRAAQPDHGHATS